MFKEEKIFVLENKDRTIKLFDDTGKILSLIFIKDNRIIIRGDLEAGDSQISPPEIKNL